MRSVQLNLKQHNLLSVNRRFNIALICRTMLSSIIVRLANWSFNWFDICSLFFLFWKLKSETSSSLVRVTGQGGWRMWCWTWWSHEIILNTSANTQWKLYIFILICLFSLSTFVHFYPLGFLSAGFPDTPCYWPVVDGARLGAAVLVQFYAEDASGYGHVEPLLLLCFCLHLPVDLSPVSLQCAAVCEFIGYISSPLTLTLNQTAPCDQPNGLQWSGGRQPVLPGSHGFLPAPDWWRAGPPGFSVGFWDRGLTRQPVLPAAGLSAVSAPGNVPLRGLSDWMEKMD